MPAAGAHPCLQAGTRCSTSQRCWQAARPQEARQPCTASASSPSSWGTGAWRRCCKPWRRWAGPSCMLVPVAGQPASCLAAHAAARPAAAVALGPPALVQVQHLRVHARVVPGWPCAAEHARWPGQPGGAPGGGTRGPRAAALWACAASAHGRWRPSASWLSGKHPDRLCSASALRTVQPCPPRLPGCSARSSPICTSGTASRHPARPLRSQDPGCACRSSSQSCCRATAWPCCRRGTWAWCPCMPATCPGSHASRCSATLCWPPVRAGWQGVGCACSTTALLLMGTSQSPLRFVVGCFQAQACAMGRTSSGT